MANVFIDDSILQGLGDFIREKTGTTDKMLPTEMLTRIQENWGDGNTSGGVYWEVSPIRCKNYYYQNWIVFNENLYAFTLPYTGNGNDITGYQYVDGSWVTVVPQFKILFSQICNPIEYNGKLHFVGGESTDHYVWDGGSAFVELNSLPNKAAAKAMFVYQDKLMFYSYYDGIIYEWDETDDAWTSYATVGSENDDKYFLSANEKVYVFKGRTVYILQNGQLEEKNSFPEWVDSFSAFFYKNNAIYYGTKTLYKYDVVNNTVTSTSNYLPTGDIYQVYGAETPSFVIGSSSGMSCFILHGIE